jgi:hypothetical protein
VDYINARSSQSSALNYRLNVHSSATRAILILRVIGSSGVHTCLCAWVGFWDLFKFTCDAKNEGGRRQKPPPSTHSRSALSRNWKLHYFHCPVITLHGAESIIPAHMGRSVSPGQFNVHRIFRQSKCGAQKCPFQIPAAYFSPANPLTISASGHRKGVPLELVLLCSKHHHPMHLTCSNFSQHPKTQTRRRQVHITFFLTACYIRTIYRGVYKKPKQTTTFQPGNFGHSA